ncbi:hypothetical protein P153DRAFT_369804 [Dothidotthia symphoricarpi CBS 119687]|uniref:Uncharacterized protein n=1 Tax=Dothidotthia symphoricarpi CBS 119687 TaxID=1392245 RepID=A0A6A6A4H3_9PLEO|nr:uncharacterized protein P153DRAFT_369804 [Dothidotthia symphoricarpi CBS 119687]KAF2125807.1 hypothetical protein P153DRAFT_369804 [Dothidotthia symphoricarpi CBS 119687]
MAQIDAAMPNAPLTPSDDADAELTSPAIDYSPATVPYNETFENDLMNTILHPPSNDTPRPHTHDARMVSANQLPIPISSHLRTHASPAPGLYLTHPNGYHTGGPGPSPVRIKEFAEQFVREHGIEDVGQLERVVEEMVARKMEEVRTRMQEREKAVERNKGVERELEGLRLQRSAELRVLEKLKGKR